jgi:hypothetical protein
MTTTNVPTLAAIVLPTVAPIGAAVSGRSAPCAD